MPTLDDIARAAGCSAATVSRVINNRGAVGIETRAAILKVLKQQGFVPRKYRRDNPAEPVSETATRLVEVVLHIPTPMEQVEHGPGGLTIMPLKPVDPDDLLGPQHRLSNSFFLRIVDGIVEELLRWGYRAVVTPSRGLLDADWLAELNGPQRCGAILLGVYDDEMLRFAARCKRPLVFADLVYEHGPLAVSFDNASGIAQALEHLAALGHRRIGMAAGPLYMTGFRERLAAFRAECAARGLETCEAWIHTGSNHMAHVAEWAGALLRAPERPTALLCGNDFIALGVLKAAREASVGVPEQLSLVGFDDIEPAVLAEPPLTTVRVPALELGRFSARELLMQIRSGRSNVPNGTCLRLRPALVVRGSTAPAAQS